ncbi:TPA: DUF1024 family protein, partial [Staphylococcus aureus]|nr:DUF1024 family protein [Staphylococcus aureus]HDJ5735256.1 DUF1024 family protein [Staphylococcus aureus]HDJ5743628.1 DUF1024 family protein [Staphylococcus aureus]HDJ5762853.1 DUF1024 family protein [Staphylococcus aureus]HDJ6340113.1 DUF1024 family protein [Staphylococcus aureus]
MNNREQIEQSVISTSA